MMAHAQRVTLTLSAVDLSNDLKPAPVTILFDERDVLNALRQNGEIKEMGGSATAASLLDFLYSLPSVSCANLPTMITSYVIAAIGDSTAVVVFAPSNSSEYCQADVTTFSVEVRIPSRSARWFQSAREQGAYAGASAQESP